MDDNCGEWVECMGVASGCGEQEVGMATGVLKSSDSGTNFLVPKVNLALQDWFFDIYC